MAAIIVLSAAPLFAQSFSSRHGLSSSEVEQIRAAVLQLIEELRKSGSPRQKAKVAYALGRIGPLASAAVPTLTSAMSEEDPELKKVACWALGEIGPVVGESAESVRRIAGLLSDPREGAEIRRTAAWVLGRIGVPGQTMHVLTKALQDPDTEVRAIAVISMGKSPAASDVIGVLGPLLNDPSERVASAVGSVLAAVGEPAVPVLVEALNAPTQQARQTAAKALVQIGAPALSKVAALLVADGTEQETRAAAAAILARIGKPAVPVLAACLSDPNQKVRLLSCRALGEIGAPVAADLKSLELLQGALLDPIWEVREAAALALGQVGAVSARPLLLQALDDEENAVRSAAAKALEQIGVEHL